MDGEAGWWITSGNIGLPSLARVMGVGRQQQVYNIEKMMKELPTRTEIQNIVVLNSRPTNQHTNKPHQSTPATTPDMVCDKSEARPDARATHNPRVSTAGDVVGNYQPTEMKLYDTVMTDTESDTPDSSMGSIIIPETQLIQRLSQCLSMKLSQMYPKAIPRR